MRCLFYVEDESDPTWAGELDAVPFEGQRVTFWHVTPVLAVTVTRVTLRIPEREVYVRCSKVAPAGRLHVAPADTAEEEDGEPGEYPAIVLHFAKLVSPWGAAATAACGNLGDGGITDFRNRVTCLDCLPLIPDDATTTWESHAHEEQSEHPEVAQGTVGASVEAPEVEAAEGGEVHARRRASRKEPAQREEGEHDVQVDTVSDYYTGLVSPGWNGRTLSVGSDDYIALDVDILTAYAADGTDVYQWTDLAPSKIAEVAERFWKMHGGRVERADKRAPVGGRCPDCMDTGYLPPYGWESPVYEDCARAVFPRDTSRSGENARLTRAFVKHAALLVGLPQAALDRVLGVGTHPERGEFYLMSAPELLVSWMQDAPMGRDKSARPFGHLSLRDATAVLQSVEKFFEPRLPPRAPCACGAADKDARTPCAACAGTGVAPKGPASLAVGGGPDFECGVCHGTKFVPAWVDTVASVETAGVTHRESRRVWVVRAGGDHPFAGYWAGDGRAVSDPSDAKKYPTFEAAMSDPEWQGSNGAEVIEVEDREPTNECGGGGGASCPAPTPTPAPAAPGILFAYVYYRHADGEEECECIDVSLDIARGLKAGADPRILLADELRGFDIGADSVLRVSVELTDPGNTKDTTAEDVWHALPRDTLEAFEAAQDALRVFDDSPRGRVVGSGGGGYDDADHEFYPEPPAPDARHLRAAVKLAGLLLQKEPA
jgi:hypothetical protein